MGRFALVDCGTYADPAYRRLSTDARLLFLWSWTNSNAAICGLYHASFRTLQRALDEDPLASRERVEAALEELGRKPLLLYDEDNEVVWVVNRVRHANRSPKVAKAMQREVENCPPSPLIEEFVKRYGTMLDLRLQED